MSNRVRVRFINKDSVLDIPCYIENASSEDKKFYFHPMLLVKFQIQMMLRNPLPKILIRLSILKLQHHINIF